MANYEYIDIPTLEDALLAEHRDPLQDFVFTYQPIDNEEFRAKLKAMLEHVCHLKGAIY